ncbi:hypothetical protein ACFE04_011445 [Oxalis oulophora]
MKLLILPLLNQSYVEKNNTEIHMASVNASDTNQASEGRDGISRNGDLGLYPVVRGIRDLTMFGSSHERERTIPSSPPFRGMAAITSKRLNEWGLRKHMRDKQGGLGGLFKRMLEKAGFVSFSGKPVPPPQAELVSRAIGDHFARFGGHLSQPPAPDCVLTPIQFLGQFPLRASVAYNVNPVADQFQRAFQTSTFFNRLYSFFNKRWFFDQVLNYFLVRSFLRFGYSISFEALDKGAIEILGPYGISYTFRRLAERISKLQSGFVVRRVRYDPWPPAWWGRLLRCGTAPFFNFPFFVRPRGCKKRERGGYLAGVVSVLCHEVPMDKGTSESSLLGAGSPLPSIPLHSIGAKLLEHGRMKSNDFSKSSRMDYYRRILGEAVSGDSPAESRMRGDLHVRLVAVHQNNCPRLVDRARDAPSPKKKSGLSPQCGLELIYFNSSLTTRSSFAVKDIS